MAITLEKKDPLILRKFHVRKPISFPIYLKMIAVKESYKSSIGSSVSQNQENNLNECSSSTPSQNNINSENDLWLDYLIDLDPADESGSFLTPEDLDEIDQAYYHLHTNSFAGAKKPNGKPKANNNPYDDFIKHKMSLAFSRAIPETTPLPAESTDKVSIFNSSFARLRESDSKMDIGLSNNRLRILSYEKGYISGCVKVLFPKSSPRILTFRKEKGWKANVEFIRFGKRKERTIYARGLCMNVLAGAVAKDIAELIISDSQIDNSGISFEPASYEDSLRSFTSDDESEIFVRSELSINPKFARRYLWIHKLDRFLPIFTILSECLFRSKRFCTWI